MEKKNERLRILSEGEMISNDTRATRINNNDLIIGPSGAGKTRGYVMPNILQANESMIVADTKGSLYGEMAPYLRQKGYRVVCVDTRDTLSSFGYNPLDYIHRNPSTGRWLDQDILKLCSLLSPIENGRDPFWDQATRALLCALVGYVMERLPEEEHNLTSVVKLFKLTDEQRHELFLALEAEDPDSFAVQQYGMMLCLSKAKATTGCITGMLGEKISSLAMEGPERMFCASERLNFSDLGRQKMAVFLTVSDTDRSMDRLTNLFYTQALQELCNSADSSPDHRLEVPVRIYLDDFATNVFIPDFDKIISVIRSREIYVSVILQSISQLDTLYGKSAACTILNNCDTCLYLGGQDVDTAQYISVKANCRIDRVLNMPISEAYLFTRGQLPRKVTRFDVSRHEQYERMVEARLAEEYGDFLPAPDAEAFCGSDLDRGPNEKL